MQIYKWLVQANQRRYGDTDVKDGSGSPRRPKVDHISN